MLLEDEPEEVLDWKPYIPPPYEFSLMSQILEFKPETSTMNKLFLDKRHILESSMEDLEEAVLWTPGSIVRTTKNGIKKSKEDRENEDWEEERHYRKEYRGDTGGRKRYRDQDNTRDHRYGDRGDAREKMYDDRSDSRDQRYGDIGDAIYRRY